MHETPIKYLDPGNGKTSLGYLWVPHRPRRHLERLAPGQKLDTNFFDLLNCFRRINAHLTSVAYGIIHLTGDSDTRASAVGSDPDESWLPGEEGGGHQKSLPA